MSTKSIFHISDLHKPEGLSYDTLLDSLVDDKKRWEEESIHLPEYIVISGDLIQGGYTDEEIEEQYNEVSVFLEELVSKFLNGDKSRLIMVPGNHDVNRACTISSMNKIENPSTGNLKLLKKNFLNPETMVRFDWDSMNFFQVNDQNRYNERFSKFKQFYDKFYEGKRTFPPNSTKEAYICSFDNEHIAFACFNSCNYLDDKNVAGNIDEDSITSISNQLRKLEADGYLIIGVWHHHYYGNPYSVNYMSRDIFFPMSIKGIRMGLFGHQHISEVADEYISPFYVDEEQRKQKRMLLVSSGTLFGGEKHLQSGFRRQFNIIEINRDGLDSQIEVNINIREDNSRKVDNKIPYWAAQQIRSSVDNKIHKHLFVKEVDMDAMLLQITKEAYGSGNFENACNSLVTIGLNDKHNRDLFDEFLQKTSLGFRIEVLQRIDISQQETILLLEAISREQDRGIAVKFQINDKIMGYIESDALLGDLWKKINS